jgi:23S rRNA pseudouridine2605 synthase
MYMKHSRHRTNSLPADPPQLIRINKVIAQAGVCSRRRADDFIVEGRIEVNGSLVTSPGLKIDPLRDEVKVDGTVISVSTTTSHLYILLNKPIKTMTTVRDPQGRKTVIDLLPKRFRDQRVFPVGRLDFYSEGLLLLTTDGDLTQKMTHPGYNHPKTYEVAVEGDVSEEMLARMRQGMTLAEGEHLRPVEVNIARSNGRQTILSMVLRQGINRQIRRMCRDLHLKILKLKRTSQGPLFLGNLPSGNFRELTHQEVSRLKKSVQHKKTPPIKR